MLYLGNLCDFMPIFLIFELSETNYGKNSSGGIQSNEVKRFSPLLSVPLNS
jgi:hypothetical protein